MKTWTRAQGCIKCVCASAVSSPCSKLFTAVRSARSVNRIRVLQFKQGAYDWSVYILHEALCLLINGEEVEKARHGLDAVAKGTGIGTLTFGDDLEMWRQV